MFREKELSSPELKKLIFQEWTFQAQKIKKKPLRKIYYILGNGLSSPKFRKLLYFFQKIFFLYFKRKLAKPKNEKFLVFLKKELSPCFTVTADQALKLKNYPIL